MNNSTYLVFVCSFWCPPSVRHSQPYADASVPDAQFLFPSTWFCPHKPLLASFHFLSSFLVLNNDLFSPLFLFYWKLWAYFFHIRLRSWHCEGNRFWFMSHVWLINVQEELCTGSIMTHTVVSQLYTCQDNSTFSQINILVTATASCPNATNT